VAEAPFYLLDTHIWFWLVRGTEGRLAGDIDAKLERAARMRPLGVSVISIWEIAMLVKTGHVEMALPVRDWVQSVLDRRGVALVAIDQKIAIESCDLPGDFHPDPADRFLVATARLENAVLVTQDDRILQYSASGYVRTIAA
jgi:PIN domain nuclease of toxin-antitoxin system